MQKKMRQLNRKWRKSWQTFTKRVHFVFKLFVSLLLLFFLLLFFIIEPSGSFRTRSISDGVEYANNQNQTETTFIEEIGPLAKEVEATHGVRPSVLIAQAALESDWGQSTLSTEANNYFGIKGANTKEQYVTKEFDSNEWTEIQASFKQYDSMGESVRDYADLMLYGTSWDANYYASVLAASNYQEAAYALQEAGYATDPDYAHKIIQIIEQHQLYTLDE